MFQIFRAKEKPELLPICAAWGFAEWACQVPGLTYESILKAYTERANSEENIPGMWVATTKGGKPAGMISIKRDGHSDRPDLNPWLGSLYVHPYYRGHDLGTDLEKLAIQAAQKEGLKSIYLYTSIASGYYQKRGWNQIGHVSEPGEIPGTKASLFMKEFS